MYSASNETSENGHGINDVNGGSGDAVSVPSTIIEASDTEQTPGIEVVRFYEVWIFV